MKTTVHYVKPLSVALLTALSITFSGSVFAVAGKFQFVNGEVQVIDTAGKSRLAQKGGAIDEGETVSSAGNGFAQIKMEDGGFFAVRPDTQFKVDTFQFNGKEDGSEKGVFSLIKGSLRSVTGLIGKKHKDNYKIQTATSTIGIRGSGADVGHSDAIGTAVRTLFGGHSLTSGGKTIVTGPGQTALAPPGQAPGYVANFPFNTATAPGGNGQGNKNEAGNSEQKPGEKQGSNKSDKPEPLATLDQKIIIPIKDTDGNNYTENKDASGGDIGGEVAIPTYMHYISAIKNVGVNQFQVAEQGGSNHSLSGHPASNYTFDSNGVLIGVADSELEVWGAYSNPLVATTPSSLSVVGGTASDAYHTPDNSIFISRGSNVSVNTTCSVCSGTDTFVSTQQIVGLLAAPALVQTLTGTTNYILPLNGSTHPTDAFGNVGTLNSASLTANFTNQRVDYGVNLTIAGKTLDAFATNVPIVGRQFDAETGGLLTVNCTGTCGSGYNGSVGGAFFGNAAATAALGYDFSPIGMYSPGDPYPDYIHGLVAFTSAAAPTATPSVAGTVGGGGAAVGSISTGPGYFNDFNVVDNVKFGTRHDLSGNVIAWEKASSMYGQFSFGAATGSVVQDGTDSSLGVIWGRWSTYTATNHYNGLNTDLMPIGGLSFITGTHITTMAELANYASFTGSGLSMGNTIGTYSLAAGSFPTGVNGVSSGSITSASATVNFSALQITAFSVSGNSPAFGGAWNVNGSGTIADFMAKNGASGINVSNGSTITGQAVGGFVGTQAQGLISTIGLSDGTNKLGGAVYMKR